MGVIDFGAVNHLLIHIYILIVVAGTYSVAFRLCFIFLVSIILSFFLSFFLYLSPTISLLHSLLCSFDFNCPRVYVTKGLTTAKQNKKKNKKNIQFRVEK